MVIKMTIDDGSAEDVPANVGRFNEFYETLDKAEKKMSRERLHSLVLAEKDGLKIRYTGKTYLRDHTMIVDFIPGSGRVEEVSPHALSKELTKILGESVEIPDAVDRTQATLEMYLAKPAPVMEAPKGIVRKTIDYVASKLS